MKCVYRSRIIWSYLIQFLTKLWLILFFEAGSLREAVITLTSIVTMICLHFLSTSPLVDHLHPHSLIIGLKTEKCSCQRSYLRMCMCMCMCICVCISVCVSMCVWVCVCVCVCVYAYVCMYARKFVCLWCVCSIYRRSDSYMSLQINSATQPELRHFHVSML